MRRRYSILDFINQEALSGILLLFTTVLALMVSNSDLHDTYNTLFKTEFSVFSGAWKFSHSLLLWINDGLMTLFFFMIGLELKRERVAGELKNIHHLIRPGIAALGGVLVPMMMYFLLTHQDKIFAQGWAIPMATDIAFSVGVLALFNQRVPLKMKIFLLTLAVLDDLAAVVIIGIFYTVSIHWMACAMAVLVIMGLVILNRCRVRFLLPYMMLGFLLWICMLKSGIHATLSGVILAFFIPFDIEKKGDSMLESIEKKLHPWIAYGVLPLFAFANAGVSLAAISWNDLLHPVVMGVSVGLVVGKPIGVILFSVLYSAITRTSMHLSLKEIGVIGLLAGIGFTMSLFIATLSFGATHAALLDEARLGILTGSMIAMILSVVMIQTLPRR